MGLTISFYSSSYYIDTLLFKLFSIIAHGVNACSSNNLGSFGSLIHYRLSTCKTLVLSVPLYITDWSTRLGHHHCRSVLTPGARYNITM